MGDRIVVTGGSGMLGDNLVRRLARAGYEVHSVDLRAPAEPTNGVEHTTGDIGDQVLLTDLFSGATAVVHCASGLPSYSKGRLREISVDGTRNVFGTARAADVPRVIHVSSAAVYGLPLEVPTSETHPRRPVDAYSRAKAEAEEIAEEFRDTGMCVSIVRPKTFLGPGRMGLFAMLFEWAADGRNFPVLGRGDILSQMLAVEDLVEFIMLLLSAPDEAASDTYNLGAAEFGTLRAAFQSVLDAAGHGKRVVSLPVRPALPLLRLLERSHLSPVYRRLAHKLLIDSYVSIDKARERLGFSPRFSNEDAILRSYDWWCQQRPAGVGRTSRDAWRQGALSLARVFF
ncbi:NAD-dependent epimerase/dehydratase family protein [Plantactinospora sp. CA-294935]|uniref:NAD-dependent epimerase/dehydratase family protein n=1 Tax=Plantactinospora sp. CA-294935 TaxID=3240012 RepID=UPI003D8AF09D